MSKANNNHSLKIMGIEIHNIGNDLYALGDLFKATGAERRFSPKHWLRRKDTADYVDFLATSKGGDKNVIDKEEGVFVCKELVYDYAMWIGGEYRNCVITAFDYLANDRLLDAQQTIAQSTIDHVIKQREKKEVGTLSHILGCTDYEVRFYYEVLVDKGLLTMKFIGNSNQVKFYPVGNPDWFCGYKRVTMLFNDKILEHLPLQESVC